ncbi:MAG: acid phosphatase [Phenylobacterium sp.]|uniref:acid phosphatase n=1 Tax=Phenylobacterium sp. TaxID=1871053 RepID=UPI00391DCAC5
MRRILIGTAAGLTLAGAALAQTAPVLPTGYLGAERWPDAARILPPAPQIGSVREAQDQAVFRATRSLQGQPRWSLAEADVPTLPPAMLKTFACAVGADLTPDNAPRLTNLLSRVGLDVGRQVASVKDVFQRKRPYLIEDGPICVAKSEDLAASPDYPSGHASWGWAIGLILTELAPDRATEILTRARAYGESRVVCGVHSPSAVEAGRTNGAAMVAALRADPQFRLDLDAARAEVEAARRTAGAPAPHCAAEAELLATPAW